MKSEPFIINTNRTKKGKVRNQCVQSGDPFIDVKVFTVQFCIEQLSFSYQLARPIHVGICPKTLD